MKIKDRKQPQSTSRRKVLKGMAGTTGPFYPWVPSHSTRVGTLGR
ncbi:MAG: hypothetical protein CM1200mP24_07110 [Gammaproteobacteria bacterium]|nr:MAG: hypothetical protein CM1200mP24_07110 [Gammaproteobacteria bacterium]